MFKKHSQSFNLQFEPGLKASQTCTEVGIALAEHALVAILWNMKSTL